MHSVEAVFVCGLMSQQRCIISLPRHASSCSPFCPPQTPRPVDKSQDSRCPTQASMRPFSCQAGKPESEAERKREAELNERTVRYLARAFQKRKWKKQESRGCCRTTNAMCGPRPHRQKPTPGRIPKAVRQTGDPSGPPASRTPESGKNGPSGQGLPRSGAVGAGSNTSAHLFWGKPKNWLVQRFSVDLKR